MRATLLLCLLAAACAPREDCEGTRDLSRSPAALELTSEEHAIGWGNTECFQCHQIFNIHQETCVFIDGVAIGDINGSYVDVDDTSSCVRCHGANGVEAWELDTGDLR